MGLSAVEARPGAAPQVGDGVIRGYLVSVEGGSTAKHLLGSGTLSSSGNKMPGMVAPAAVAIATGNPIGLIVVGGMKVYGEASGRRAQKTGKAIITHTSLRTAKSKGVGRKGPTRRNSY
jgi:hypothetical protein